jgi:hypothetical protein
MEKQVCDIGYVQILSRRILKGKYIKSTHNVSPLRQRPSLNNRIVRAEKQSPSSCTNRESLKVCQGLEYLNSPQLSESSSPCKPALLSLNTQRSPALYV